MTKLAQFKHRVSEFWANKQKRNIGLLSALLIISVILNVLFAIHLHMSKNQYGYKGYKRFGGEYGQKYKDDYRKNMYNSDQNFHNQVGMPQRQMFVGTMDNTGVRVYQTGSNQVPVQQMTQDEAAQVLELMQEQEARMNQMWQEHELMMNKLKMQFGF